jgi:hypothetical protein
MQNAKVGKTTTNQRWPDRDGWDDMANAIEVLAQTCGAYVYFAQKYEYLSVEIQRPARTPEQTKALHVLIEVIEQASDQE